ncbi:hypothetical protein DFP73DRAFT_597691 [Morchella snyderi]|nr:hypothetical protein DFP73DRAFT_597691 [Morchella snyderi]
MFKTLPLLLLLVVFLLSPLGFTDTIDGNVTICETTPSSPSPPSSWTSLIWASAAVVPVARIITAQMVILGAASAARLSTAVSKFLSAGRKAAKAGGKWRHKGGEFMILIHI